MHDDDALLEFAEEVPAPPPPAEEPWRVLVVDDDEEVHLVTALTLRHARVDGAALELVHADSCVAAMRALSADGPFAVAVVDVVMESAHAGLDLAAWIRETLGDHDLRIVLRTGQPGAAVETQLGERYDIHDYLGKAETTGRTLTTRVMGAVRAFRDLSGLRAENDALRVAFDHVASGGARDALPSLATTLLQRPRGRVGTCETAVPVGPDAWLETPDADPPNRIERLRIAAFSRLLTRSAQARP